MFVYFSKILNREVIDKNSQFIGCVYDIIAVASEVYPKSSVLVVKKGFINPIFASIPWSVIESVSEDEFRLNIESKKIHFLRFADNREELSLRRDILDQQVVDTHNHNVIRINDIHLLKVGLELMIAHVDIGTRGIIRRLGFEKIVDTIIGFLNKNARYLRYEKLISWKYIQPLSINPVSMTIKVNVPQKQLSSIPSADFAELLLDLDQKQRFALFSSLDPATRARVFSTLGFNIQKTIFDELPIKEGVEILESMPSDESADFLGELPDETCEMLLSVMGSKNSKKLSQLLGYSSDSAGGFMTTEYLAVQNDALIDDVLKEIKEKTTKVETIQYVYITDEKHKLIGSTNLRRLIGANTKDAVLSAAFPKTIYVHLNDGVKKVAYMMDKYKCYALPVVNDEHILQGIITIDDVLSHVISIAWNKSRKKNMGL